MSSPSALPIEEGFGHDFDQIIALGSLNTVPIDVNPPSPETAPPSPTPTITFKIVKKVSRLKTSGNQTFTFGQSRSANNINALVAPAKDKARTSIQVVQLVALTHCTP